jgi:cytosolic phospholipase A2
VSLAAGFSLWALTHPNYLLSDSHQKVPDDFPAQITIENARILAKSKTGEKSNPNEPNNSQPDHQAPRSQSPVTKPNESDEKETTWNRLVSGISDIKWSTIPDKLTSAVTVPEWIRLFPAFMTKFQNELSMAPGSLAEEIWREANDPECNPEIMWDANVRISDDLCTEEKSFLKLRKQETVKALAKYLDIPASDIHPDDVPTIAMCGSGGGLRALVAGTGSYISTREAGLFDCITYTAGVSGSCWLQSLYFSSMGLQTYSRIVAHLKNRLGVHMAYPPAAFNLINSAPTNKFLLTGLVEKLKGTPDADFGIVDVYGMLLASRLLVPKAELAVDLDDLKLSTQTKYIDQGQNPLPIYTAVRHEIPVTEDGVEVRKEESWFQWFE